MRHLSHRQPLYLKPKRLFWGSLAGVCTSIFIVSSTLLAFLTVASSQNVLFAGIQLVSPDHDVNTKKVGDYRKDLKFFVKQSKSQDESVRYGAVLNLCVLHHEIVSDQRYETNQQLQGFRAVAADRLKKCKKEIELKLLRDERARKKNSKERQQDFDSLPEESSEFSYTLYEKIIADDMHAMTSLTGGPINLWQYTGNPSGPFCDYGPDLVNLITNTINPDFWRRNGGNGIIEYYQPLRIIVVGASGQVQEEIADLLNTLRANGR